MPMLCIAGVYRILQTEPDGDSLRFVPDDPDAWGAVPGSHRIRVNASGGAQLRIDAIDALETHYTPQGGHQLHQPLELGHAAGAELLRWIGFRDVRRDGEKVVAVREDGRRGWILTRTADTYGRCVALAGRGDPPGRSGTRINVGVGLLRRTVNHRLIKLGLAYPTFYSKLYFDLRDELAAQAGAAREAKAGVYAEDETQSGVKVEALSTLTDHAVILPKLFRRLADYLHLNGDDPSLQGFERFLADKDDRVLVIPTAHKTGLDTLVDVRGQVVELTRLPEELVFDEQ